jgi:hypothetical protein
MTYQLDTAEMHRAAAAEPAPTQVHALPATPNSQLKRWLVPALGVLAVVVLGGAGVYFHDPLLSLFEPPSPRGAPKQDDPVTVLGPNLIAIAAGTPLEKRLHVVPVQLEQMEYPLLSVTGYVMARLAPGADHAESRWDFASSEVATAYGDWLNARAEALFLDKQAEKTRELIRVQVDFLKDEMARKESGVNMGAVPPRDLISAKADFMKADIQGKKDVNEAETNFKKAERNRGGRSRSRAQGDRRPGPHRRGCSGSKSRYGEGRPALRGQLFRPVRPGLQRTGRPAWPIGGEGKADLARHL